MMKFRIGTAGVNFLINLFVTCHAHKGDIFLPVCAFFGGAVDEIH